MWYNYLNREQYYLRSYRTHNLWFDYYHKKCRVPRVVPFHLGVFKKLSKTYSGVSLKQKLKNLHKYSTTGRSIVEPKMAIKSPF